MTADNMAPARGPNVDSAVLLAVAFALLSLVVNRAILGNYAFTRSFELYFLRSVDDAAIFQKDLLIGALQYNPYFWLHRLFAVGRDALHISTGSMIVTTYFAVQVLLMYGYYRLTQAMFVQRGVSLLVLVLLALKYSPWTFGSANGLNLTTLTPNLLAIGFQVLALSCFFSNRFVPAATWIVAALYCHALSSGFLVIAFVAYLVVYRRNVLASEAVPAAAIVAVGALPLAITLGWVALKNATSIEPWQLASAVDMAYGHVSLRLWAAYTPFLLGCYAVVLLGFLYCAVSNRTVYRNDEVRAKVLFLSGAAVMLVLIGGTVSEQSSTIASLQPLKVAWFLELLMGLFAAKVIFDAMTGGRVEDWRSLVVAAALLAMHVSSAAGRAAAIVSVTTLFASCVWLRMQPQRLALPRVAAGLMLAILVAGPYAAAGVRPPSAAPNIEGPIDSAWAEAMAAVNALPADAYVLYPFARHMDYFALSERPGFFNLEYVSFLTLGCGLPAAHRFLVELLQIDKQANPAESLPAAWSLMTETDAVAIQSRYAISHIVRERGLAALSFPVVHINDGYVIYRLPDRGFAAEAARGQGSPAGHAGRKDLCTLNPEV